jgi:hypothetical protein
MFWLLLVIIVAVTLSGAVWLPYTGSSLPRPTLIMTSIASCVLAVCAFLFSWRYWNKKV